jgi:hypothetical protein
MSRWLRARLVPLERTLPEPPPPPPAEAPVDYERVTEILLAGSSGAGVCDQPRRCCCCFHR